MARLLVAFGAVAGVVGLFMPFVRVTDRLGYGPRSFDLHLWGATSGIGIHEVWALLLLGFFLLVGLLALWALSTRFSRALAATTLFAALPPAVISIYLLVRCLSVPNTTTELGLGLVLLTGGGMLALLGSGIGLWRPDPR